MDRNQHRLLDTPCYGNTLHLSREFTQRGGGNGQGVSLHRSCSDSDDAVGWGAGITTHLRSGQTPIEAMVNKAAALVEAQGKAAFVQFRVRASEWWSGNTYLFAYDKDFNVLLNPAFPKREGANVRGGSITCSRSRDRRNRPRNGAT